MATEVSPDQMEESTESRRMRMIEPKSLIDEKFLTNFDLGEAIEAIGAERKLIDIGLHAILDTTNLV